MKRYKVKVNGRAVGYYNSAEYAKTIYNAHKRKGRHTKLCFRLTGRPKDWFIIWEHLV
jgi:hypothetical protein